YAALSIIIAFLMTGHRSVFPSQLLAMKKSEALDVNLGEEINNTHATYTTKFFENIGKIGKLIYRKLKEQRARNKDEDL
ncbi:MAG: voltage-gated chloride channel, partial [Arcobacter sp.]